MEHLPVLLNEVLEELAPANGDIVFDGTSGGGGHAEKILERILPGGKLIAVDKDPAAAFRVKEKLKAFGDAVIFVNDDFRNVGNILDYLGIAFIDKALFDLGMSSFQVDDADRGFSFASDGPLDMRFDPTRGVPASRIVNVWSESELTEIIRNYGEERHASLVAREIARARKKEKIETTLQLKEIVGKAVGWRYKKQGLHPAARTFQALRICVNDELGAAEGGIKGAMERLSVGGRVCVISFHSLEDRIAKNIFKQYRAEGRFEILTKKPRVPDMEETWVNRRARSAKLRSARRVE